MVFIFQMIFLPEGCDYIGSHKTETIKLAEPLTGATMGEYRRLAKQHNVWLSIGGFHEVPEGTVDEVCSHIKNYFSYFLPIQSVHIWYIFYILEHIFHDPLRLVDTPLKKKFMLLVGR